MNYYAAKFARQNKDRPTDWIIKQVVGRRNTFELVKIR